MREIEICFANITILDKHTFEIVAHEGLEISETMLDEYFEFVETQMQKPVLALVDKKNSYTYAFDAQQKLTAYDGIYATAVVSYTKLTNVTTSVLAETSMVTDWNMKIFTDRDKAIEWLEQQKDQFAD